MQYELIKTKENASEQITSFGGLNRLDKTQNNEFSDMLNMSSDRYPCLAPAKSKEQTVSAPDRATIRAVIAPQYSSDEAVTTFTGVAGNAFYYKGEAAAMEIPDGDVTLVDFNGRIIICVYDGSESHMLYYDYTATGGGTVKEMENGIRNIECSAYSEGDPEEDISVTNYIRYVSGATDEDGTAIDEADFKWENYFEEGDSVFIEGFSKEENNTVQLESRYQNVSSTRAISCIVEKTDGKDLYLQLYNRDGNALVFTEETHKESDDVEISVYTKMPTMNHICIHNNRLWGTNPNGEFVYASKLGDPFNFNTFQGLANDSYYCEVGTAGGFIGIVSYRDNLVAFKREYIHHIYGDKPSNFTMPKQIEGGCIDIKSAVQLGQTLYFLGYGGFYAYTGGEPQLISQKLDRKYKSACAAAFGQKYIVSCTSSGGNELLVLDAQYGLWHREEYIAAVGAFKWHDKLYIATANQVYEYGAQSPQSWNCESVIINEEMFDNKGMTELWIRAKIDADAKITVYTSEDGGDYLERKTLTGEGRQKVYRVPIRFINGEFYQYKLTGKGNAVVYSIERVVSSGGRRYKTG